MVGIELPLRFTLLCAEPDHGLDSSLELLGIKSVCTAYGRIRGEARDWTSYELPDANADE